MKKILIFSFLLILILLLPLSFSKEKKEVEPPNFSKNEIEEIPLRLKARTFDPVKEKRIETLSIPLREENYIVQFNGPIKKEWKKSLEKLAEIHDYIPEYAFLVKAKPENLEKIKRLPFVRWVGKYEAEYKIEPEILKGEINYFSLSKKEEENRIKIILFSAEDLEKVSEFISRLNGNVLKKEGTKIIASIEKEKIKDIANLKEVKWIEFYREPVLLLDVSTSIIKAREVWNLFNGSGIKVAVVDSGIDNGNLSSIHPDLRGRIVGLLDYTETDESDGIAEDPYGHGTHVAGIIAGSGNASNGNYTGVAPSSLLIIQRVFNDSGGWEGPENLTVLFSDSKNLGAQIVSNSWGRWSWGEYTDLDKEADEAVRNYSLIIIFAAGNDGPYMESTLSPSNAKNVISVGASENNKTLNATYGGSYWDNPNEVASFSSRGPTNDKRVKPDLVAPGTAILSTKSSLAPDYYYGGVVEGNGGDYGYLMGTSQAAPHVAGAAAIILEYFNKTFGFFPSPALVKALLINGAEDMGYGYPSYKQGWGRLNIKNSIIENETRKIIFKEENTSISTENYSAFKFFVQNNSMLKITLVWTDWPGDPAAEKALVNDLDLFVLTPSGYMRRGNDFSFPYDDEKDDRNNVENVFINISEIEEGNYTVVVYGYNIPMEPQKFALVLSGNLTEVEMLPDEDVFPPAIWDVTPGNNQTTIGEVEIRANVTDNIEVSKVWIEYSNDTMNWDVSEMSFNGEIYSGSLNVTSEGTWIYRVLANDTSSKISSSRFYSLWTEEPRKIFVVRSMGTSPYDLNNMPWEKLNNNWFNYGLKPIVINYTFLNIPKITYENLTESKADVLLIASAYDQFTYSEIEAIKRYTKEGHGLIATGRTLWYIIPNNNKLAPLFGMREDLSYTYTYFSYINLLNQNHPIFRNIPLNYSPNYPLSCVPSDYSWNESDLVRGTFISLSDNNVSAIIVNKYKNVSYITHMPEYYSSEYDIQLLYNALTWSNYTPEQHDLEVEWIKINKPYVRPNENFTLEAKISNYGIENETNISVMFLVNGTNVENKTINLSSMESTQVYFNYSNSSTGIFNLSVYVFGNESETLLENNVLSKFIMITNADVILVDDDRASYYETYYEQALKDNGIDYVLWDSSKFGTPPNSTLMDFNITIWFTGNDWITTLTSDEISSIKDFLDNGGNLFISGQDIGYYLYYSNYPFYRNYFHSKYMRDDSGILKIEGMEGDGIGDGLVFDIHGGDGANNQIWPDEIEPYDEFANPIFKYFQNGYAGIRAQTLKYNLIYLAFGFEGINNSQDRKEIMNRSINFFYKYLYDKPPITFLDCPNYTYYTNSQPIWLNLTAIDDFKLENATLYGNFTGNWQKNETIFISNNTENGTALNLAEGVYIWNYLVYDNSSFYDWGNKNCTLIVDRTLPIISSVSASPSYTYATISWQTNEPTNSTLYYGTSSTNLNYQLNSTSFSTTHVFTIYGLNSNTKYYYKVSSCDRAGNCNSSQIYEFKTLYQAYCGNGICDSGETYSNCPQDCPSSTGTSGSGSSGIIELSGASFGLYLFLEPEELNISIGETKTVKARVVNPQNTTLNNITLLIESNCCNITFSPSSISKLKFAETKEFTITLKPFENASGEYYIKVRAYSAELAFAYKYLKIKVFGVKNITQNITENVTQNVTENITDETEKLRINAENIINLAERKISELKQMNLDVRDLEELLEKAREAFENGDYKSAISLANQAYSLALSKVKETKEESRGIDIKVYVGVGVGAGTTILIVTYLRFMRKPKVDEWEMLRRKWGKST